MTEMLTYNCSIFQFLYTLYTLSSLISISLTSFHQWKMYITVISASFFKLTFRIFDDTVYTIHLLVTF